MATLLLFSLVIVGTLVLVSSESVKFEVGPIIEVTQLHGIQKSSVGVVEETRSCGGSGQLVQWRYETCKPHDTPCQAPSDGTMKRAEVDFIPSKDISSLGLRLNVASVDGAINKKFNFEGPIHNDDVKKGQVYTITLVGGVTDELKGKLATFQYIIYDKMDDKVEVCAESMFQYV